MQQTSSFEKYSLPSTDLDIPNLVTSKYHRVSEFQKLDIANDFNIYHSNANGLESKFDTLHNFVMGSNSLMDVIAITETSENFENSFITNVSIEGFKLFSTTTLSPKGGTALYMNEKFDAFERQDLRISNEEFQGVWAEIKNTNSKNIVCGCIYRHPRDDMNQFFNYMESTLKKLSDENKEIYICGDFNIDLLKINSKLLIVAMYLLYREQPKLLFLEFLLLEI